MTLTLPGLLVLLTIAAICGAVGKALAGGARGGLHRGHRPRLHRCTHWSVGRGPAAPFRAVRAPRKRPVVSDPMVDYRGCSSFRRASSPHVRAEEMGEELNLARRRRSRTRRSY